MPRQSGGGLKYWSFDVGLLRDKKIRQIKGEFGLKGVMIFIYILNTIYEKEGYFMKWEDDDDCCFMSDDIGDGCSPALIDNVVHRCIKRSLFDERVFNMFGVLTSASIQRRFLIGVGNNRSAIPFIEEYWLLDTGNPNDVSDSILKKLTFFSQNLKGNAQNLKGNAQTLKGNDTNKIKENKSKVNKSKEKLLPEIPAELSEWWSAYVEMRVKMKKPMTEHAKKLNYSKLMELSKGDLKTANEVLKQSVMNSWLGLFPLKENGGDKNGTEQDRKWRSDDTGGFTGL